MAGGAPPELSPRLTAAFDMARRVHDGTALRGTDVPYLLHVLEVSSIVMRHGGDEDQATAALLHDVVEHSGGEPALAEIREEFGDRVADIVLGCSDSVEVDTNAKLPWWPRKIAYIDHLHVASPDVAMVGAADKLANVRSILADLDVHGDAVWKTFMTGRMGTLWYYRRMADILLLRLPDGERPQLLGARLARSVQELIDVVDSEGTRLLEINTPGGFEGFHIDAGAPAPEDRLPDPTPPDIETLMRVGAECGCQVLAPPVGAT